MCVGQAPPVQPNCGASEVVADLIFVVQGDNLPAAEFNTVVDGVIENTIRAYNMNYNVDFQYYGVTTMGAAKVFSSAQCSPGMLIICNAVRTTTLAWSSTSAVRAT